MAKSLFSFIGTTNLKLNSNLDTYKKALVDFLCPISARRDIRGECEMNLENAMLTEDETYNPFKGVLLECNFNNCLSDFQCTKMPSSSIENAKKCVLINKSKTRATTLVKEYKAYLEGFMALKGMNLVQ